MIRFEVAREVSSVPLRNTEGIINVHVFIRNIFGYWVSCVMRKYQINQCNLIPGKKVNVNIKEIMHFS